jgi:hypothetical protein
MKHLRTYILTALLLVMSLLSIAPTVALAASPQSTVCSTLGSSSNCGSTPSNGIDLNNVVTAVVQILSAVVGIAAVIMIIVAGIRFVTSGGDSSKVAAARSTILYAVVGLAIAAFAQVIVRFVLSKTKT